MRPQRAFDGVLGWCVAQVMARTNRTAELEAIELLAPRPDASVLVIGYGPGVGVRELAARLETGRVVGVDPSQVMQRLALKHSYPSALTARVRGTRRCRRARPRLP